MQVYVTLPKVHVYGNGIERRKEIYVVSFASDLHGESNHRQPAVGASNETIYRISPPESKFFVVSVSNIFERVTKKHPLSLSGDGIILYPPSDPKGLLAVHFAVIESDRGTRDVGKMLSGVFGHGEVRTLLGEVAKFTAMAGSIPAPLLTALFGAVAVALPTVLKANKDDVIFSHNHSGVEFNDYGGSYSGNEYAVENDIVKASLRVWARD